MIRTLIAVTFALAALALNLARAQDWPARPITVVVPFAAGGPVDVVARVVAPRMSELLGQPVIVDNIAGAGGMVGASRIAKADPDGYSILFGNQGTHTFSQILNKRPLYNAVTDFAAGGLAVSNTKLLVARRDLPANTLSEFITYAKAKHASMQYGSAGSGSATQIACVLLNARIGIDVTHVPYRGTGPALQDLIAGRIDYVCDVTTTTAAQIRSGTVKAIATLSITRSAVLPEVPTALEQGLADVDADGWNGFFFPKDTSGAIIRRVAAAVNETLDTPLIRKRIEELGLKIPPPAERTPEFLARLVASDLDKWGPPVRAAGVTAE